MGPVLYFRGSRSEQWHLSALIATAGSGDPPYLSTGAENVAPHCLACRRDHVLWRYDFSLPVHQFSCDREYRIGERKWQVRVPGSDAALRVAFTACNGSEDGDAWEDPDERNALWSKLSREQARAPFHLLLQGGDQLYADPIWREVPVLAAWRRDRWAQRRHVSFSPEMAEAVANFYFDSYCRLWSQRQLSSVLASVPSLMMWDDHDIIDGWGSYPPEWQDCSVFQGIWTAAREYFALFQLAARPDDLPEGFTGRGCDHFGWAYRIGRVGLIAPDLRSERSRTRIMSEAGRRAFAAALENMSDCRHVLLVSTVPLVNPQLSLLERIFALTPGHQALQDDLIDQWVSLAHRAEWSDFLTTLLGFSARTGARVTSLSGEIHLGAWGLIESAEARIHQLTSSGVVHPPPPSPIVRLMNWASSGELKPAPGVSAKLLPIPGTDQRLLAARNWLELNLEPGGNLRAAWHAENSDKALQLTIQAGPL